MSITKILTTMIILFALTFGLLFYAKDRTEKEKQQAISASKRSTNTPTNAPEQTPLFTTIATNLQVPWALAFLPNGDMLITERAGNIRILRKNQGLDTNPLLRVDEAKQIGEGGLLGIAIHPDYPKKPYVYLYYTYGQNPVQTLNRVVRYTLKGDTFSEKTVLVDAIPGAIFHDGGRLKFGPDGLLYITAGDARDPSLAQTKSSLAGKILRVTDEGKAPPSNPFSSIPSEALVYSYGHRNPQGLAWDANGRLWETEHGESATDELNRIEAGKNYGWPTIRGTQQKTGLESPILQSGSVTWAPSGIAYYNGSLFFGGLRGEALFEVLTNQNPPQLVTHFKNQFGRIRDVVLGADNMLYITTSNRDGRGNPQGEDDRIIRVNPEKL